MPVTLARLLVSHLRDVGVTALFGMPGGGSNLDLIEAAGEAGLPFVLAHTETAGALMACAQAEITGRPGACLATLGPGAASLVNGVAHAWLDRVPLLAFTDRHPARLEASQHQRLDHQAIFGAITKRTLRLGGPRPLEDVQEAVRLALAAPRGPIHVDCEADVMTRPIEPAPVAAGAADSPMPPLPSGTAALIGRAVRPLVLAGLGAATPAASAALRAFCEQHHVPAMVTYKAKGVVPDGHPLFAGVFTNATLEAPVLAEADLLMAVGLDPVELLPKVWAHPQPVIACGPALAPQAHVPFAATVTGPVELSLAQIGASYDRVTEWDEEWLAAQVAGQRQALRIVAGGLTPFEAIEIAAGAAGPQARVTVDAGAHMLPATVLWPVAEPRQFLISNGLSTMGFALPAAIGAAVADRTRRIVAVTGDGGLLMCAAELRTAAREQLPIVVLVLNDAALSLIDIKQRGRGHRSAGVQIGDVDWRALAGAMGVPGWTARTADELADGLDRALALAGPSLIDARINAEVYPQTLRAVRG
ncbi:MAG: thiamine pyrophosphate-binding protein [Acidobacteriota bacterium]|nr:thiamine pyrophosphate-binding protein [Acidobacteriota bacterium]